MKTESIQEQKAVVYTDSQDLKESAIHSSPIQMQFRWS